MKVLLISDVHGDIKKMGDILGEHQDADIKIFLGDFQVGKAKQEELTHLFDYVVRGNNDHRGIAEDNILVNLDGVVTFMTHGDRFFSFKEYVNKGRLAIEAAKNGATLALHGHDHKAFVSEHDGVTVFNPGSPSFPRFGSKSAYGIIMINNGVIESIKHIYV